MQVANGLCVRLSPVCKSSKIVGSLRRNKPFVGDIELLCIPNHAPNGDDLLDMQIKLLIARGILDYRLNKRYSKVYGPLNKFLIHMESLIAVDIFSTTRENWFTSLVVRTGPKESNIRIASAALKKGWKFHAYGSGFTDEHGNKVTCRNELDVFLLVGLPYKRPEER